MFYLSIKFFREVRRFEIIATFFIIINVRSYQCLFRTMIFAGFKKKNIFILKNNLCIYLLKALATKASSKIVIDVISN